MSREAMKLALEALEMYLFETNSQFQRSAVTALRDALAEQPAPVQEPVAYGMWDTMLGKGNRMMMVRLDKGQDDCTVPLYTSPQAQRTWVGLTEDDKETPDMGKYVFLSDDWIDGYKTGMKQAEAKLKEKNA